MVWEVASTGSVLAVTPEYGGGSVLHVVAFALATVIGAYAVWNGTSNLVAGYRLWAAEPTPVAAVGDAEGTVEIRGTAEPLDETLSGHFSTLPVLVQEWETRRVPDEPDGTVPSNRRPMTDGRADVPFVVRDDSGTVAVDPTHATLSLERDRDNTSHGVRQLASRLEPGDDVYVFGQVCTDDDSDAAFGGESVSVGAGDDPGAFRIADTEPDETVVRLVGTGALYAVVGAAVTAAFGVATTAALGIA
ncbi:E3 ubiquitin ligase family protein [Halovivax cerinus]|uniref:E3 ubiquitin ligase family protein n=1 Tax=Halovivax cerinus TaxID=1487865 RepID=A0ABD5NIY0_9EURY|nr:E3 ubiquitin ligase family protein [Halovivax cerinus]